MDPSIACPRSLTGRKIFSTIVENRFHVDALVDATLL
jgi:hypothetical protein